MLTISFNPYTWDRTAEKVRSNVVSLQLKDDKGMPVTVDNLKSKIKITIPQTQDIKKGTWKGDLLFVKPSKHEEMQYHAVNVDIARTSLHIVVRIPYVLDP